MSLIVMPTKTDYSGRVLALNPEKARRFQCGGFFLGPTMMRAVVPPDAQMDQIHQAVLQGKLLDITDLKTAVKSDNFELSRKESGEEDTGLRAFMAVRYIDGVRHYVIVTPKDAEEAKRFQEELEKTGSIDLEKIPMHSQDKKEEPAQITVSKIIITDLEENK